MSKPPPSPRRRRNGAIPGSARTALGGGGYQGTFRDIAADPAGNREQRRAAKHLGIRDPVQAAADALDRDLRGVLDVDAGLRVILNQETPDE